jgi:hypothetical protein
LATERDTDVSDHQDIKKVKRGIHSDSIPTASDPSKTSDANKQANTKTPSFMRRELELGGTEEDVLLDEWPEMDAYSLSELSASSDASLDESHNWWDRRRRRRAVDCKWTEWGTWTPCTASCGTGQRQRNRTTEGPHWGGTGCTGPRQEFETCSSNNCAVACEWNHWGAWGPCSRTCGNGFKTRKRGPMPFTQMDGGAKCNDKDSIMSEECSSFTCPQSCVWAKWGLWGGCTKTCGTGIKVRSRDSAGPFHGGSPCVGNVNDQENCNAFSCPIDCAWNSWGAWGECSKSCGGGLKLRQRMYLPMAHNGGKVCPGSPAEILVCNVQECPVDCVWAPWHDPSPCTKSCGGGSFKRHRSKIQAVANGGKSCDGEPSTEIGPCNVEPCAVDCQFLEWSTWSECSESCGGGTKTALRNATKPEHGGAECSEANMTKEAECNTVGCPGIMVEGGAQHLAAPLITLISVFILQARMSSPI